MCQCPGILLPILTVKNLYFDRFNMSPVKATQIDTEAVWIRTRCIKSFDAAVFAKSVLLSKILIKKIIFLMVVPPLFWFTKTISRNERPFNRMWVVMIKYIYEHDKYQFFKGK